MRAPCGRRGPSSEAGAVLPISTATEDVMTRSKKKNCRSLKLVLICSGRPRRRGSPPVRVRQDPSLSAPPAPQGPCEAQREQEDP